MHIYIYRERERDRYILVYIYNSLFQSKYYWWLSCLGVSGRGPRNCWPIKPVDNSAWKDNSRGHEGQRCYAESSRTPQTVTFKFHFSGNPNEFENTSFREISMQGLDFSLTIPGTPGCQDWRAASVVPKPLPSEITRFQSGEFHFFVSQLGMGGNSSHFHSDDLVSNSK